MGPNGQALISSIIDAHILCRDGYSHIKERIKTLSGSEDLLNAMNWIAQSITIDK
jgi:hypothetical protein